MSGVARLVALSFAAAALLVGAIACGDDGDSSDDPTATARQPTASATPAQSTPIATGSSAPNEGGQAPIFWRPADNFASVIANQPYKVLFRITSGYAEPTLTVHAVCTTCRSPNEAPTAELSGIMVTPVGEDAPGSYYPVDVRLPRAGHWELTVQADADSATIPIDVKPSP